MTTTNQTSIDHVSDTALWVAYYRAKESKRPDALFHDPLALSLIGERGKNIAENMKSVGRYTEWSVISRTVIIDQFIQNLISDGVDTVVNLGAGLDTRPYRMNLPRHLKWIEVDYPQIISHKNTILKTEKPNCQLSRVELDLSDDEKRKYFLTHTAAQSKKILILTEGVIPYLSEAQVNSLAADLLMQPSITYWITEFFTPEVYRYLKASVRTKKMQKALFQFYPTDWLGFFEKTGWVSHQIQYSSEVAVKYKRRPPMPWFAFLFMLFASQDAIEKSKKMTGYMVFKRKI